MIIFRKSSLTIVAAMAAIAFILPRFTVAQGASDVKEDKESNVTVSASEDAEEEQDGPQAPQSEEEIKEMVENLDGEQVVNTIKDLSGKVQKRQDYAKDVEVEDDELDPAIQMTNKYSFVKMDNNGKIHVAMPYSSDVGEGEDQSMAGKAFNFIMDMGAGALEGVCKVINSVTD